MQYLEGEQRFIRESKDTVLTRPSSSSQPDTSLLDRLWSERPYAPRAIALLFHFMEVSDRVTEDLEKGDPEMLAQILADSYPAQAAFEAEYGIEVGLARAILAQTASTTLAKPEREAGDFVDQVVTSRLIYRLGYIDGLRGADTPPTPSGRTALEAEPPIPENESERRVAERAAEIVQHVLNPAYEAGFMYGTAERVLGAKVPALRDAIDEEAVRLLEEKVEPQKVERALRKLVRQYRFLLSPKEENLALIYAEARSYQVREHRARAAVMEYVRNAVPVSPIAVAAVIRVLAREGERAETYAPARVPVIEDELEEAIVLAAVCGFPAKVVTELMDRGPEPGRPPSEIIASSTCDTELGALRRRALMALGQVPEDARSWPEPQAGIRWVPPEVDELKLRLKTSADVDALLRDFEAGNPTTKVLEELLQYRSELEPYDPEGEVWPLLVAHYAARMGSENNNPEMTDNLAAEYARIEAELATFEPRDPNGHLRKVLLARVAREHAATLLGFWDPSGEARVRAELELIDLGEESHLALAENWLRSYKSEADALGATPENLMAITMLRREDDLAEGVLLRARARLIEAALDEWALREARYAVIRGLPDFSASIYTQNNAQVAINGLIFRAEEAAYRAAQRLASRHAVLGARLERWIPVAALETLVSEMQVVDELTRQGDS